MKALFELTHEAHGRGPVKFAWQADGNFLASSGNNGLLNVYDRHGQQIDEVALGGSGEMLDMGWDKDGEILAVLVRGSSDVMLYDLEKKKCTPLETGLKDPSFIKWSASGPQLVIGTSKGGIMIYRKDNRKKLPVMGKHSGDILCGAWSPSGYLALGSADNTLSISNVDGDTINQIESKFAPRSVVFSPADDPARGGTNIESKEPTQDKPFSVAINMDGKTLMLYSTHTADAQPVELAFEARYGQIMGCEWCGESFTNLVLAFSAGYLVVVSTDMKEIGEELYSLRAFKNDLKLMAISDDRDRVALCGDNNRVRVIDLRGWKELTNDALEVDKKRHGTIESLVWSRGGQIVSISTDCGTLLTFLARIPHIVGQSGSEAVFLSSLRELSIVDTATEFHGIDTDPVRVPLEMEPTFVALGVDHVAVGANNRAWIYRRRGNPQLDEYNRTTRGNSSNSLEPQNDGNQPVVGSVVSTSQQEYVGSVDSMHLNSRFSAALCSGRVYLNPIDPNDTSQSQMSKNMYENRVFPSFQDVDSQGDATCVALTEHFLVYGTREGFVAFYSLQDGVILAASELRHVVGIRAVFPNHAGTRVVVVDETGSGFVFNPVDSQTLAIPDMNPRTATVFWDSGDAHVFVTSDGNLLNTYVYSTLSINGPQVLKVCPMQVREDQRTLDGELISLEALGTSLPPDYAPVLTYMGNITCQLPSAQLGVVVLGCYEAVLSDAAPDPEISKDRFLENLSLLRLQAAWEQALMLNRRPLWIALSSKAMEHMDIQVAINVWRQLGDAGMVMALEKIRFVEDKHLLAGHIAALFGDYAQAQELFLLSPNPRCALDMRRDLLHWDHAMTLAETLAPDEIPDISVEFAQQLEFRGEYAQALQRYEAAAQAFSSLVGGDSAYADKKRGKRNALVGLEEKDVFLQDQVDVLKHRRAQCTAGVARMTLRVGNIPRGVNMATASNDTTLCRECADILVSLKQFPDAAVLYEHGGEFEEAASIYIKAKNFKAAAPLMAKITAPRLHLQFAKAKEAEKDYKVAAQEYDRARDMDSVVRLYLDHLNLPEKAFTVVRQTQSAAGAEMVARYCQGVSDFRSAIEFLLMAKQSDEAFDLATVHDCMEAFERALGSDGSPEEYVKIAHYHETRQHWGKAGELYAACGQFHKALKLFLQSGQEDDIDKAIDVVGKARNDMLTHTLIDFLMGDTNGAAQPPKYIFRLYMALGNYSQAAKTAIVIARQEQERGDYKDAHRTLYETHRQLESSGIRVPQALRRGFLLLHSYLLVKKLVKLKDHDGAARMLIRVARNVSRFPVHVVNILTSTVIECYRADLKASAFEYASILMRPEHRGQIDQRHRRRIETIVRRRGNDPLTDAEEPTSPCPYTGNPIPVTTLTCPDTMNDIPFCVVSGRHMVIDDWCICPNSKMPALYSQYVRYLEALAVEDRVDPVTGAPIAIEQLVKVEDPKPYLEAYSSSGGDAGADGYDGHSDERAAVGGGSSSSEDDNSVDDSD